jgi:FtsH-binding integral membrane protein
MPAPAKPERRAIRLAYRGLLGLDLLIAAVVVTFFLLGLLDGSVSSYNGLLWLAILAGLALVLGGAMALRKMQKTLPALLLLLLLALPGGLFGAFMLLLLITQPNWN